MKCGKIVKSFYGIVIVQEEDKYLNKFILLKSSRYNNSVGKEFACNAEETPVRFLLWEDPLEKR